MPKQYRNEWKYTSTTGMAEELMQKTASILTPDSFGIDGRYTVHSMYFDDYKDTCARENEAGTSRRYKYRIRYYGDNTDFLRFERKEKLDGRCHKDSAILTREQYDMIMSGDYEALLWSTENKLLREFATDAMMHYFRPKSVITYDRVAYVDEATNVRITFDENISVSDEIEEFLSGDYLPIPLQSNKMGVIEVKFDEVLPSYIRHIIANSELVQGAFSKYYFGRIELQSKGRIRK